MTTPAKAPPQSLEESYSQLGLALQRLEGNVGSLTANVQALGVHHEKEKRLAVIMSSSYVRWWLLHSPSLLPPRGALPRWHFTPCFVLPVHSRRRFAATRNLEEWIREGKALSQQAAAQGPS